MRTQIYETADAFLHAMRPFLEMEPVSNQLILASAARLAGSATPPSVLMTAVYSGDRPILAAMITPPHSLVLSRSRVEPSETEDAAALLGQSLADHSLPGIMGQREPAAAFSAAYCARRGLRHRLSEELGLYRLTRVIPPAACLGKFRAAAEDDIPLLTDWREKFSLDIQHSSAREDVLVAVRRDVESGNLYLWECNRPVSTAVLKRPIGKGISIGGVYTPPEFRRRGYASACVAALSQFMLDKGYAYCSLYTNLANPTSNHIYQAIGYEPVGEVVEIKFDCPNAV
ncbi:MAG: uncharacterized protein QG656_2524 [Candidatus Hydrogenedentes bacterium]|nr:uncharacterized protein [Candidatus Hydrogenedentota bacterium]